MTAWPSIKGESGTRGGSAVIIRNRRYRFISLSVYPIVAWHLSGFLAVGGEEFGVGAEGQEQEQGVFLCWDLLGSKPLDAVFATAKGPRLVAATDIDILGKRSIQYANGCTAYSSVPINSSASTCLFPCYIHTKYLLYSLLE